jgi:hypothetical protein
MPTFGRHFFTAAAAGRIPRPHAFLGDGLRHHAARANHHAVADADGQNRGAAADRHVIANLNPPPAGAVGVWFAVAKQVVGKHHAVTDKAAPANGDVLADKGMGLNFTVRADAGIPLDLNERPDEDVIAERAVVQVGGLVNNDIFPQTTLRTPVSRSSGIVPLKAVWPEYVRCFAGWRNGKSCL